MRFRCNHCEQAYKSLQGFQRHYASKHATVRFSCPSCGKQFSRKSSLNQQAVHSDDEDYHEPILNQPSKVVVEEAKDEEGELSKEGVQEQSNGEESQDLKYNQYVPPLLPHTNSH